MDCPRDSAESISIGGVLTDGAVLLRDRVTPVWGRAAPGTAVKVAFAGHECRGVAGQDGSWRVELPPLPACGEPRRMVVRTEGSATETVISNLLVGEVWLASGQSNMELPLRDSAEPEWTADPLLRLCRVPVTVAEVPAQEVAVDWACLPSDFSAVAYGFGVALRRALGVPVGLIHASLGSTGIACWLPAEDLAGHPARDALLARHAEQVAYYRWAVEARRAAADPGRIWLGHDPRLMSLSGLYNGMIAPLQSFPLRGFIWYQGETDTVWPGHYEELFPALIAAWRRGWRDEKMPFLFAQLTAFEASAPSHRGDWPALREVQRRVAMSVPRTGMAVTLDFGERADIHPKRKRAVGERLSRAARAVAYGETLAWHGPRPTGVRRAAHELVVAFDTEGLELTTLDGEPVRGFEVLDDGVATAVPGRIVGSAVHLPCNRPAGVVRYAWSAWTDANLCAANGLPAGPFRLDVKQEIKTCQ
jgi:sialate O-acetylesterase